MVLLKLAVLLVDELVLIISTARADAGADLAEVCKDVG